MPSKKRSAIDNILGVSDRSADFEERMQSRIPGKTEESGEDSKSAEGSQNAEEQQNSEQPPSEQRKSGAIQKEKVNHEPEASTVIAGLQLDTQSEQTTKASYYLSPKQAKRLDDLRTVFRYDGGYAPRDASYSRIVGLAIERLHEEVFRSGSDD